jgi:glycosyltransferase involved in cell wall biosynthesis
LTGAQLASKKELLIKIVFLSSFAPLPVTYGGSESSSYFASNLTSFGDVTILWPYEGGVTSDSFLFDHKLNQRGMGLPIRYVFWIRLFRFVFGEFGWGPAYAFTPFMARHIAKHIENEFSKDTMIIVSHPWLGKSLKYLKDYNSVYFAHNIEAKIIQDSNLGKRRKAFLSRRVAELEREISLLSKKVAFVSEDDLNAVDWNLVGKEIQVIGVGASLPNLKARQHDSSMVFIGGDYLFNIEAAQEMIEIARKMPEFEFKIVGSVCDKIQTELSNVSLLGWVSEPELTSILENSAIFINPMKHGSGIHLKLAKAMSFGIPIISTQIGWRGFNKLGNLNAQILPLEAFPQAIRITLDNYEKFQKLAIENQFIVRESFSWEVVCKKFNAFVSGKEMNAMQMFVEPIEIRHEDLKYENQIVLPWRKIFNRIK